MLYPAWYFRGSRDQVIYAHGPRSAARVTFTLLDEASYADATERFLIWTITPTAEPSRNASSTGPKWSEKSQSARWPMPGSWITPFGNRTDSVIASWARKAARPSRTKLWYGAPLASALICRAGTLEGRKTSAVMRSAP